MTAPSTVELINALRIIARRQAGQGDYETLLEAADRLEHFAWDGMPPRTPHLAADSSPDAGDVDAGASPPTRRVGRPASGGDGGEVRLGTAPMPLAAEFSDSDPTPPHGVVRPVLHRRPVRGRAMNAAEAMRSYSDMVIMDAKPTAGGGFVIALGLPGRLGVRRWVAVDPHFGPGGGLKVYEPVDPPEHRPRNRRGYTDAPTLAQHHIDQGDDRAERDREQTDWCDL